MQSVRAIRIRGEQSLWIDDTFPWWHAWREALADALDEGSSGTDGSTPVIWWQSGAVLPAVGLRKLEEHIYVGDGVVVDRYYRIRLEAANGHALTITSDNPALEWLSWSLQLGALLRRATFVHCAALERDGEAVIFPAWGGIGKTALVAEFVRRRGWRLLGDDLAILSADGICYGFPKAMVIYPYHRAVFPELFRAGRGPAAPVGANALLTRAGLAVKPVLRYFPGLLDLARRHNPQSRRIPPSAVFGRDKLAKCGHLRAAIWIDRVSGLESPRLRQDDGSLVSRVMGSTMNEYDPRCIKLTNIAMGMGLVKAREFYDAWSQVLGEALRGCRRLLLSCPANSSDRQMADAVEQALREGGITLG